MMPPPDNGARAMHAPRSTTFKDDDRHPHATRCAHPFANHRRAIRSFLIDSGPARALVERSVQKNFCGTPAFVPIVLKEASCASQTPFCTLIL
jgi:hypothetical protein